MKTKFDNHIYEAMKTKEPDKDKINWDPEGYYDDVINLVIKRDCKQWLNVSNNTPAYRRTDDIKLSHYPIRRKVRQNRKPRGTVEWQHRIANDLFQKHFGIKARSECLFIQGSKDVEDYYGEDLWAVFPIGNFDYIWAPDIQDLMARMNTIGNSVKLDLRNTASTLITGKDIEDYFEKELEITIKEEYVKNKGLRTALRDYGNNEIMVKCREYYLLEWNTYQVPLMRNGMRLW
jgi:hypothetical protein